MSASRQRGADKKILRNYPKGFDPFWTTAIEGAVVVAVEAYGERSLDQWNRTVGGGVPPATSHV